MLFLRRTITFTTALFVLFCGSTSIVLSQAPIDIEAKRYFYDNDSSVVNIVGDSEKVIVFRASDNAKYLLNGRDLVIRANRVRLVGEVEIRSFSADSDRYTRSWWGQQLHTSIWISGRNHECGFSPLKFSIIDYPAGARALRFHRSNRKKDTPCGSLVSVGTPTETATELIALRKEGDISRCEDPKACYSLFENNPKQPDGDSKSIPGSIWLPNASIDASASSPETGTTGAAGLDGANGFAGPDGQNSGNALIDIDHIEGRGRLSLVLDGMKGSDGQGAGNGGVGGTGGPGRDISLNFFCSGDTGQTGDGGIGGIGGLAGVGGQGGFGGHGGLIGISKKVQEKFVSSGIISASLEGGEGGRPGESGQPGKAGPGGKGGEKPCRCVYGTIELRDPNTPREYCGGAIDGFSPPDPPQATENVNGLVGGDGALVIFPGENITDLNAAVEVLRNRSPKNGQQLTLSNNKDFQYLYRSFAMHRWYQEEARLGIPDNAQQCRLLKLRDAVRKKFAIQERLELEPDLSSLSSTEVIKLLQNKRAGAIYNDMSQMVSFLSSQKLDCDNVTEIERPVYKPYDVTHAVSFSKRKELYLYSKSVIDKLPPLNYTLNPDSITEQQIEKFLDAFQLED